MDLHFIDALSHRAIFAEITKTDPRTESVAKVERGAMFVDLTGNVSHIYDRMCHNAQFITSNSSVKKAIASLMHFNSPT
jgi:hypothetical protein